MNTTRGRSVHNAAAILVLSFSLGCGPSTGTGPSEEVELVLGEAPIVTAFVNRLGLRRPIPARPGTTAEVRSFDRTGKLVAVRALTPAERMQMIQLVREILASGRPQRASTPSGHPASGADGGPGQVSPVPTDTSATFEVEGQTFEVEAVAGTGVSVLAVTSTGNAPMFAGWGYFVASGDTTSFTAVVGQVYDDGLLVQEVYAGSGIIEELNEEILETAPAFWMSSGCNSAEAALFSSSISLGIAGLRFWAKKSVGSLVGVVTATGIWLAAARYYACECQGRCYETAPPMPLVVGSPPRGLEVALSI